MISPNYLKTLQHEHQQHPWGYWGYEMAPEIRKHCDSQGITTVLDYGCGSSHGIREWAKQYSWPVALSEYDPAVLGYDLKPKAAELVVCIDVMEHVEEQFVERVLDHIQDLSQRQAWFRISLAPAQRTLKLTGQNAHITLHTHTWWLTKLQERFATDLLGYDQSCLEFRGRPLATARTRKLRRIQDAATRITA